MIDDHIALVDQLGASHMTMKSTVRFPGEGIDVATSSLAPGSYILRVSQANGALKSGKIIVR